MTAVGRAGENKLDAVTLFSGSGEMRERCRTFDWAATPLGPTDTWPVSLRTLMQLVLEAELPMAVHWGPDAITIYNDAYAAVIGPKHPATLGRPFIDQFPETRGFLEDTFAKVRRGEPVTLVDTWFPIRRHEGLVEACFTVSHSPVRDESGAVAGVLVVFIETTDRARAESALRTSVTRQRFLLSLHDRLRPLSDSETIKYEAAHVLGEHLGASRVGYAEIDADGLHMIVTRNYTNGVRGLEGRYRVGDYSPTLLPALMAGRTVVRSDIARDVELSETERAAHAAIEVASAVDVPLVKEGRLVAVLFMHHREPHTWNADEIALLEAVAERTWEAVERARTEGRLRAGEARLQLALDVAKLGTWETAVPFASWVRIVT